MTEVSVLLPLVLAVVSVVVACGPALRGLEDRRKFFRKWSIVFPLVSSLAFFIAHGYLGLVPVLTFLVSSFILLFFPELCFYIGDKIEKKVVLRACLGTLLALLSLFVGFVALSVFGHNLDWTFLGLIISDFSQAGFRPDIVGSGEALRLVQAFAYCTLEPGNLYFLLRPLLLSVPMVWIIQILVQVFTFLVALRLLRRRNINIGIAVALSTGIAFHPIVIAKICSDYVPWGGLWLLLAKDFEDRNYVGRFSACLVLAALSHPIQSLMAVLWGLHRLITDFRQLESASGWRKVKRALLGAAPLVAAFVPSIIVMVGFLLWPGRDPHSLIAPYSRLWVIQAISEGNWLYLLAVLFSNVLKLLVVLIPFGFLPLAKRSRFLLYCLPEMAYSLPTPHGFEHGSIAAFCAMLACASAENANRVSEASVRRFARVITVSLLPLSLLWSNFHFFGVLVTQRPVDRLTPHIQVMKPDDIHKSCVGSFSNYFVLEAYCKEASFIRHQDNVPSTLRSSADVVVVDVDRLSQEIIRAPLSIQWGLEMLSDLLRPKVGFRNELIPLEADLATEDIVWLRNSIVTGELVPTAWYKGVLRLDRRTQAQVASVDIQEVIAALDKVLSQRTRRL